MIEQINSASIFQSNFNVSRETINRLTQYLVVLNKWNHKINLVAPSTLQNAWHRHFADSAQLWALSPHEKHSWLDIGSGAGFPGLVIAAMAAEKAPQMEVTLIESDKRKCVFLQTAAREMGVNINVVSKRIEELPSMNADIISARALASLPQLLEFAEKHRNPDGICLFPKGARANSELTAATSSWHIQSEAVPSITDSEAVVLRIGAFHRAE